MNTHQSRRRRRAGFVLVLLVVIVLGVLAGAGAAILPRGQRIAPGVAVDGMELGGLLPAEARARLTGAVAAVTDQQVALLAGDDRLPVSLSELGARPDLDAAVRAARGVGRSGSLVARLLEAGRARWQGRGLPLAYAIDDARAQALLEAFAARIDTPPVDARARWNGSAVVVTPGHAGARLEVSASLALVRETVMAALAADEPVPETLELVYQARLPRVTTEMLSPIDTVLGEFSTSYATSSRNRAGNIETASGVIDGVLVMPGEVFSFNGTVGPRTRAKGYREAPVIVNGEMDTGIGGGICQVSTTLYNAVLLANLGIVARSHHSLPSHYVKTGMDATVSYSAPDFKFRNTMTVPVAIEMQTGGRRLTARVLGQGPRPDVRIERTNIAALPGRGARTVEDPTLPKGRRVVEKKGRAGIAVTVVRVVGSGPDAVREVISRDRYPGSTGLVRVGTGPEKPPAAGTGPGAPPVPGTGGAVPPAPPE